MATRNDITGDAIQTKSSSAAYREGWERIFGKKAPEEPPQAPPPAEEAEAPSNSEENESTS